MGSHGRGRLNRGGCDRGTLRSNDQTLSQCIVVQVGQDARWHVLVLSLWCSNLSLDAFTLASATSGHVKVGLVALLDAHVSSLLRECNCLVVRTEGFDELLVDAKEGRDQGRVDD